MKIGDFEVPGKYVLWAAVGIFILWALFSYNGLVSANESIDRAMGQVNNVLQRQYELIPNLVEVVKG